jgi:hypothetical protein
MTSPSRRRAIAVSTLAPLTAVALGGAVGWEIGHDSAPSDVVGARAARPSTDPRAVALRADVEHARASYNADRRQLVSLQREIADRTREVARLRAENVARIAAAEAAAARAWSSAASTSGSGYAPASSGGSAAGGSAPPAPAPAPAPPPPPPPTQSTTGAS